MRQVLLVTGGYNYNDGYLDTTEVLEDNARTWRLTAPLPSARSKLRASVLENNIFVFGENILCYINIEHLIVSYNVYNDDIFAGGVDNDENDLNDILRYNKNHTWEEVGQLKEARSWHAVAVMEDVSNLCT